VQAVCRFQQPFSQCLGLLNIFAGLFRMLIHPAAATASISSTSILAISRQRKARALQSSVLETEIYIWLAVGRERSQPTRGLHQCWFHLGIIYTINTKVHYLRKERQRETKKKERKDIHPHEHTRTHTQRRTHKQKQSCMRARTYTHTHTHTHTRTHPHTRARACTLPINLVHTHPHTPATWMWIEQDLNRTSRLW
jgi:hypothetical protein